MVIYLTRDELDRLIQGLVMDKHKTIRGYHNLSTLVQQQYDLEKIVNELSFT